MDVNQSASFTSDTSASTLGSPVKHTTFSKTASLLNMLKREESANYGDREGSGFHSTYEPREILGR